MRFVALTAGLIFASSVAHSAAVTHSGHTDGMTVDFRTSAWSAAQGLTEFTLGGVTVKAHNPGATGKIFHDSIDGLGVYHAWDSNFSELDYGEKLTLTFATPMKIGKIYLTDLYKGNDGGPDGEEGVIKVTLTDNSILSMSAWGNAADQVNGAATLSFADMLGGQSVKSIEFLSNGEYNDDYSVAGLLVTPLPGAVWVFGVGVAGLAALRRRRIAA